MPRPGSELAKVLQSELESDGGWHFRKKTRLEPNRSDFGTLSDWLFRSRRTPVAFLGYSIQILCLATIWWSPGIYPVIGAFVSNSFGISMVHSMLSGTAVGVIVTRFRSLESGSSAMLSGRDAAALSGAERLA